MSRDWVDELGGRWLSSPSGAADVTRPNWFFAFPIDGRFVLALPELPHGLRRFHPDDVHLTIAFLGGSGEPAALRALDALDAQLARVRLAPLPVALGAVVAMGPPRRYSALSALLTRGSEPATAAIAALRDVLADAAGVARDTREPKAHVTVARPTGRATPSERRAGLAWAAALDLGSVEARLDRIALYTWSEERAERQFRVVAERRL